MRRERVRLNRVRLITRGHDRNAVAVSSTFDRTVKLDFKADEDFSFPDDDMVVIRNLRSAPVKITIRNFEPSDDANRLIITPSRQATRTLMPTARRGLIDRALGRGIEQSEVTLGPEESCVLRSDAFLPRNTRQYYARKAAGLAF